MSNRENRGVAVHTGTTGAGPLRSALIFDYPVANDYRSFLVNEAQLVALRKRFEGYTGPVVNAGGVR